MFRNQYNQKQPNLAVRCFLSYDFRKVITKNKTHMEILKKICFVLLLSTFSAPVLAMTSEQGLALALCTQLSQLEGKKGQEARHFSKLRREFPSDYSVRIQWANKVIREVRAESRSFSPHAKYLDIRCPIR